MSDDTFRARMLRGDNLVGTFLKTPAPELVEVLAMSGLDFIALDAEHAPFDRGRLDACLAIARALGFPALVRLPEGSQVEILKALDSGATGIIVPHVATAEKAGNIAKWSRFGHGGRGYAGSTRWAGFATRKMADVLAQSVDETVVIAQIEEPEGVEAVDDIAATDGIDGLFVGPADLAVCFGLDDISAPQVMEAMAQVAAAASRHKLTAMTFLANADQATALKEHGIRMFFVGSDHGFILSEAQRVAAAIG